jgi:hypothetical protein
MHIKHHRIFFNYYWLRGYKVLTGIAPAARFAQDVEQARESRTPRELIFRVVIVIGARVPLQLGFLLQLISVADDNSDQDISTIIT